MPITGVPVTIAAIYNTAAGQSIAHVTETVVNFDTKVKDTHNAVTTGAAWKFTAPVAGFYYVSAVVCFATTTTWADGEVGVIELYVNGVAVTVLNWKGNYATGCGRMQLCGGMLVYLNAGDYIHIGIYQSSGAALALRAEAISNCVSIVKFAG